MLCVYQVTENFPKAELYGLTSQFRRVAVSIAANTADGFVKIGKADKLRFYNIDEGSIHECKYYIILAKDLGNLQSKEEEKILEKISKLLGS